MTPGLLVGKIMILIIQGYQLAISPWLGPRCRFQPTCSTYFIESIKKYGVLKGTTQGVLRILRCHPFHPGGHDPP